MSSIAKPSSPWSEDFHTINSSTSQGAHLTISSRHSFGKVLTFLEFACELMWKLRQALNVANCLQVAHHSPAAASDLLRHVTQDTCGATDRAVAEGVFLTIRKAPIQDKSDSFESGNNALSIPPRPFPCYLSASVISKSSISFFWEVVDSCRFCRHF